MDVEGSIFLVKAEENLAAATDDYSHGRYNSCANRCYYACFQAAIVALQIAGIRPSGRRKQWDHDFVQAEFVGRLINQRKLFPGDLRSFLQDNLRLRQIADYSADVVTETQAKRALRRTDVFVSAVRQVGDPHSDIHPL